MVRGLSVLMLMCNLSLSKTADIIHNHIDFALIRPKKTLTLSCQNFVTQY